MFYYSASAFTSTGSACGFNCHYLEAAPTGWSITPASGCATAGSSSYDPYCAWSGSTNPSAVASVATAIGTGYANSLAIIAQDSTAGKAATAARAYQGGSKTDWFLPSRDELDELCKYANSQATGTASTCTNGELRPDFRLSGGETDYWSSSQDSDGYPRFQRTIDGASNRHNKFQIFGVRPVRAFG